MNKFLPQDWWIMDGVRVIKVADDWWLSDITEEEYIEFYQGTPGMSIIHLFRTPPQSDKDYFSNYLPSKLFREIYEKDAGLERGSLMKMMEQL